MSKSLIACIIALVPALLGGAAPQPKTSPPSAAPQPEGAAFYESELIFPLEHWHNHASCIVECPNGDLLVCWFHGSGERTADDVKIEGARLRKGAKTWDARFTMADTLGYPDTNPTMFIDPQQRLWLLWPTILANEWHTALMKYRISSDYQKPQGVPRWDVNEVLHITPGPEFEATVNEAMTALEASRKDLPQELREAAAAYIERTRKNAADKLFRRLGWMTRAHPFILDGKRLIVPLYSDGFSFSLMAITDDWGKTWTTSTPIVGAGNIQPSIVKKQDGTLFTLMRDNGPPPKRLHTSESRDGGKTWSADRDTAIPNPGSGAEIIALKNGHWALIYNDTELSRNSLAVSISTDEGQTWKWTRHLEIEPRSLEAGAFHYPSMIQARDGSLHASYSYHLNKKDVGKDAEGQPARKAIKHAHFNEAWVIEGDKQ
ncbi:MAG TPA: exo-alpha-sialidase [Blastocatellia bacterium]|nr:exo-alpha-sialidase [Blastocatellia bacterium]